MLLYQMAIWMDERKRLQEQIRLTGYPIELAQHRIGQLETSMRMMADEYFSRAQAELELAADGDAAAL